MLIRIVGFVLSLSLLAMPVMAQVPAGPGPSFFYTGTAVGLVNSSTTTTILTVPIVAGYVTSGVHCRVLLTVSTGPSGAGDAISFAGVYGTGASVSFVNAVLLPRSIASGPIILDIYLQQKGTVISQGLFGSALLPFTTSPAVKMARGTLTQKSSGPLNLVVNAKWGAASNLANLLMDSANCNVGG